MKTFLFFFLFLGQAFAQSEAPPQDFDNLDPAMNMRYERGRYLVYDCDGYFVCTKQEEFDYCLKRRETALTGLNPSLECAPIKEFKRDTDCQKRQQELTDEARQFLFCTHPEEKFLR